MPRHFYTYLISCHLINSLIAKINGNETKKKRGRCRGKSSIFCPSSFQNLQNTVPENTACAHNLQKRNSNRIFFYGR